MIKEFILPLSFSKATDDKRFFKVQTTCACKLHRLVVADDCEGTYTIESIQADSANLIPFPQPAEFYTTKAVKFFGRPLQFNCYLKVGSIVEVVVSCRGEPDPSFRTGLIVEVVE